MWLYHNVTVLWGLYTLCLHANCPMHLQVHTSPGHNRCSAPHAVLQLSMVVRSKYVMLLNLCTASTDMQGLYLITLSVASTDMLGYIFIIGCLYSLPTPFSIRVSTTGLDPIHAARHNVPFTSSSSFIRSLLWTILSSSSRWRWKESTLFSLILSRSVFSNSF